MSDSSRPVRPPGPDGKPIVGSTFSYARDPLAFIRRIADEYGPVATYTVGGEQMYQVSSPEFVKRVLVDDNEHYRKGDLFQDALRPVLGNGLLTSEGEFWRDQRHTMQSAFHPDAIQAYADVMVDYTERLLEDWSDGETRDVHEDMMRLTVEIAAKALFDVRLNEVPSSQSESQSDSDDVDIRTEEAAVGEALEAVMDLTARNLRSPVNIPTWVPTPTNRRYEQALEELDDISHQIIQERRAQGVGDDPTDVVGLLLNAQAAGGSELREEPPESNGPPARETGAPIDDQQLVDEVVTILLAGHETTALALTYTLHALGETPDAEAALHDEVDSVLGGPDDPNRRSATYEDLDDLTYVDRCITEGMRLYPPVWELLRETTRDEEFDGYVIPEGSTVAVQQWVLHHDDTYYEDPWTFRPERWTDDFRSDLPAFAYFPFGGGPRRCIGDRFALQEARLALATIARDWTLEPEHDLEFEPSITLRPTEEVRMTVRRR